MRTCKYFSPAEFRYPDKMNDTLLKMLDLAREILGCPILITSDYRTPEENSRVGGGKHSAHLFGYAVDIKCGDSSYRYMLLKALLSAGFTRIGIYPCHIHVDVADFMLEDADIYSFPCIWYGK